MTPIRLVACDMDGTFLTSERLPHPENIRAVAKLVESGVIFCLASGRGISTMQPLLGQLTLTGPIVSSNGAHVTCPKGSVVFDSVLDPHSIIEIITFAEANDIHVNHYLGSTITFSKTGELADLYVSRTGCTPEFSTLSDLKNRPATKLLFIGAHEQISNHADYFLTHAGLKGTSIVRSEPDYLEFLPQGITKGVGVQKLAEHLGIAAGECAAIGDWHNDREMLEWVGYRAAVQNATPEIKSFVQSVFSSNNDAGVAEFIESIIERNKAGIVTN